MKPKTVAKSDPGFYQGEFEPGEVSDLEAILSPGLRGEIDMLRVVTRRLVAMSNGVETVGEMIDVLKALSGACGRLATLLKIQRSLGENDSEVRLAISQALSEVLDEMGIHGKR